MNVRINRGLSIWFCNRRIDDGNTIYMRCPNCGADMRGENDEGLD